MAGLARLCLAVHLRPSYWNLALSTSWTHISILPGLASPILHLKVIVIRRHITVAPLAVAAFTENMSCGYEGMYNTSQRRVVASPPAVDKAHLRVSSALPLLLVPSANSTQCVSAWNLS
ncbi:hypothetical protein AAFF_G00112610 [Aldrovandia affinis]|uniref:Uncharacterized protein n=1 Tax=Aldrovandia affinis TaxID=143900 RepID=A0AAD7RVV8_9TELE|nr:hypothetical protein AAFF_G00112610 [Aldrovandia affinis]